MWLEMNFFLRFGLLVEVHLFFTFPFLVSCQSPWCYELSTPYPFLAFGCMYYTYALSGLGVDWSLFLGYYHYLLLEPFE
jgi:hypothetical protein